MNNQQVVVIGGGTGTNAALTGLKHFTRNLTAVVTMADDGGSSGRLRDEFGHLPPGDVRRCLVALSADGQVNRTLRALFEYRFDRGVGLNGHSFGNLFLTALTELTGSTEAAIEAAAQLLNVRGRVLPATTQDTRLWARLKDGTLIRGEHNIDVRLVNPEVPIQQVFLSPPAHAYPPAAEAIRNADLLVIGPGDLYTSLIPNLLVEGVPEAVRACKGTRIFVCNLMTKHGETDGYAAEDFIATVTEYLGGPGALDCVAVNNGPFSPETLHRYAEEQCHPVKVDLERCAALAPCVVTTDLAARGDLVRHDPRRLAVLLTQVRRAMRGAAPVTRRFRASGAGPAAARRHDRAQDRPQVTPVAAPTDWR